MTDLTYNLLTALPILAGIAVLVWGVVPRGEKQ